MKFTPVWVLAAIIPMVGCQNASLIHATAGAQPSENTPVPNSNNSLKGEYLLQLAPNQPENPQTDATIAAVFHAFAIGEIKAIGHSWYLLRLDNDPGLATIQATAQRSDLIQHVQPNYRYGINPPDRPVLKPDKAQ